VHLSIMIFFLMTQSYPGMVTYKRPNDKGGVPVYQPANNPSAAAYQQLMQLQQPFVPVSCKSNFPFLANLQPQSFHYSSKSKKTKARTISFSFQPFYIIYINFKLLACPCDRILFLRTLLRIALTVVSYSYLLID